jgi:GxxExxY protein
MDTDEDRSDLNGTTRHIIGCAYRVANQLGAGFLEKVYENALVYELEQTGLHVRQQYPVEVRYGTLTVGVYVADIVVADQVLVELKAVRAIEEAHVAQCVNYLKATGLRLGLLINSGTSRIQIKRVIQG